MKLHNLTIRLHFTASHLLVIYHIIIVLSRIIHLLHKLIILSSENVFSGERILKRFLYHNWALFISWNRQEADYSRVRGAFLPCLTSWETGATKASFLPMAKARGIQRPMFDEYNSALSNAYYACEWDANGMPKGIF